MCEGGSQAKPVLRDTLRARLTSQVREASSSKQHYHCSVHPGACPSAVSLAWGGRGCRPASEARMPRIVGGRPRCCFHFTCRHCLLAGHPASGCVLSPERDRYCVAAASANQADYLAALAHSSHWLFGGAPAAAPATPPPMPANHQDDWNQRMTSLIGVAQAAAVSAPTASHQWSKSQSPCQLPHPGCQQILPLRKLYPPPRH